MFYENLPMSGFEPRTSGIRGDRSANWATTTAQASKVLRKFFQRGHMALISQMSKNLHIGENFILNFDYPISC